MSISVRERERRTQFYEGAGARAAHPKSERLQDSGGVGPNNRVAAEIVINSKFV